MKYIIGILLGMVIVSGSFVYANTHGMEEVNSVVIKNTGWDDIHMKKIYDNDNGTVCYTVFTQQGAGSSVSISCVK